MEMVTVIIPVYNVETYLARCVESVIRQTYNNIEIILIDDGSTDKSGNICDDYAQKDTRVRVYHQDNQGLSAARNVGLDNMQGEFVTFIDSDDYVSDDYIEVLYKMLIENKADISCCMGFKFYNEMSTFNCQINDEETKVLSKVDALESMLYRSGVDSYAWGKLYNKKLFQNLRFPVGALFEDVRTVYKVYDMSSCIVVNPVKLYYYYQRTGSIVNSSFSKKRIEQVTATEEILDFVKRYYPKLERAAVSKCFIAAVDVYRRIPNKKCYETEKKYLKRIIKKYRCIVFMDKKNKKLTRVISLVSFLCIKSLNIAGRIYQLLIEKEIIKVKNPI